MRLLSIIAKITLTIVVYMSLLTGCVVVEHPYHYHGEGYRGYYDRR